MREQVYKARATQARRFGTGAGAVNSRMSPRQLRKFCPLDSECQGLLQTAMEDLGLSARAHDRILRMARTIADLDGSPQIGVGHLSEAIQYRSLDRRLWAR
jgi:magnesium chelatase family protein